MSPGRLLSRPAATLLTHSLPLARPLRACAPHIPFAVSQTAQVSILNGRDGGRAGAGSGEVITVQWRSAQIQVRRNSSPPFAAGREKYKGGFTLIELLVVIAIIGILAAMILTAVNKAKSSAGKATDLNNLKQIMVATHVYASDAKDVLPAPNWDGGWAQTPGWLYDTDFSLNGRDRYVQKKGLLWPSLGVDKVFFCPNDKLDETRPQLLSSYAMNGAVVGYSPTNEVEKLSKFQPTDCTFWETDETHPNYFNDGANFPGEGVSPRHSRGGIQAVFDGSVNYVRLQQWYEQVAETNRNRLWCYPETENGRAR